ncbi:replication-relaxation family protein [Streptomyces sp. NPDC089424]|uniref:replication-relaxation family protein n=1 Tax=Streptomyces sp. NPDC089424 TaxID=3365917 RepID=UPI003808093D
MPRCSFPPARSESGRGVRRRGGHKDNKVFRNACLDLARHGLTLSEGAARDGNKLWGLTPLGLDAAAEVLGRGPGEMGGIARGAARSGAPHAMAVNETVIAITRTPPAATRPIPSTRNPATAPPTETAPAAPEGIGSIFAWSTEVALNLPSTGRNRSGVRADAVLQAPVAGVPVLLVEVDNCTEAADVVAAKFDKYLRFFRLQAKDHRGRDVPAWRNLYPPTGREGHPPGSRGLQPEHEDGIAGAEEPHERGHEGDPRHLVRQL